MHLFYLNRTRLILTVTVLLFVGFFSASAQQSIGAYPNIDAGFENQTVGSIPSGNPNTSATQWSYVTSGNGQVRTINATGGNGGPKYFSLGKNAPTTNTSTTANSNIISAGAFEQSTKYIIQFHYKSNTGVPDPLSYVFISMDGTSGARDTTRLTTLGTPPATWTKFSTVVTTNGVTTPSASGVAGMNIRIIGTANGASSAVLDVDNFVVYKADNQTTPAVDITAPNAVTGLNATAGPAVVNLSWTAPAGGVDGGGYMVVRYESSPTGEPAPVQNAVYKATATNTIGTGVVVYVGDSTHYSDATGVPGTNYFYRVYAADKAFNYSNATATTSSVSPLAKINYYYKGIGLASTLSSWGINPDGTGSSPSSLSGAGLVFRLTRNITLDSLFIVNGLGSSLIIGDPVGANAPTIDFNSSVLPGIDTIYQSGDGNPTVLNFNKTTVPAINILQDIFTEVHYRGTGGTTTVSTSKAYDKIVVENGAEVTFTGTPSVTTSFTVALGSSATVGTLSTRWLSVADGGTVTINGKIVTPKLIGLVSSNVGTPANTFGAIQFIGAGDIVLGPNSTVEYSGISITTTQNITPRTDYVNMIISGVGVSKTMSSGTSISGSLTMNTTGATGLILTSPLTLNGTLNLQGGKINTDATNILTLGASSTLVGGRNSSYISGPVKRNTASTNTVILPVGKGGWYRPVSISPSAATASVYQAEFFNTVFATTTVNAPLISIDTTYWNVSKLSGANASVGLSLDSVNSVPNATAAHELVVANFNGTSWVNVSATPINPGTAVAGTALSTVLTTSFTPFTFGVKPTSVVPVTLISFKGQLAGSKPSFSWTTTNEQRINQYVIEESNDGRIYQTIGTVAARNQISMNSYSFISPNPIRGLKYYRLRIESTEGKSQFSNVVALRSADFPTFNVIQNPVKGQVVRIQLNGITEGNKLLQLVNMNGQTIATKSITYNGGFFTSDISFGRLLPKGNYVLRLVSNEKMQPIKITIE